MSNKLELTRYTLHRLRLLPPKAVISYTERSDTAVQATVYARQTIDNKIVLQASFEITAQGKVRLAYDSITGEVLNIARNKEKSNATSNI